MRITKISSPQPDKSLEARFEEFVDELEVLSNRYGIALRSIGGVQVFDPLVYQGSYDRDFHSEDVELRVTRR